MSRVYQWRELAKYQHLVDPKYGVTFRKLDYWTREGHLGSDVTKRPGSGVTRRWTWAEVQLALAIGALTEVGFQLSKAVHIAPILINAPDSIALVGHPQLPIFVSVTFDAPKEPER